jgi:hypothetical protein
LLSRFWPSASAPHAPQHIGRLGKLNVVVTNDLYSVAPGAPKIKEWTIKYGNTSRLKHLAGRLPIIDNEAEVATIVCGLPAALLKSNKLIAQVDESSWSHSCRAVRT